ncbi:MAG: 50S ribosomal protein L16 [Candidatus Woesearchaeota archaeon]
MAKLRKFIAYRRLDARPYTRRSKYRSKSFVRTKPHNRIVRYQMGNLQGGFPVMMELQATTALQIRDNAIESARQVVLRKLEKNFGKKGFLFEIRVYPHHVLRENPLASGAGADRMSTGMKMSFGKPIGVAARIRKGQTLFRLSCQKDHVEQCKKFLSLASTKLPCSCKLIIHNP